MEPKRDLIHDYITSMTQRLEQWVREQRRLASELETLGKKMEGTDDRLTLLLSAQAMLAYIERTLKDFESWLNNPMITAVMPLEMLKKLEAMLRAVAVQFINTDIEHTSEYRDLLNKMAQGDVPDILKLYFQQRVPQQQQAQQRDEERRDRGLPRIY